MPVYEASIDDAPMWRLAKHVGKPFGIPFFLGFVFVDKFNALRCRKGYDSWHRGGCTPNFILLYSLVAGNPHDGDCPVLLNQPKIHMHI